MTPWPPAIWLTCSTRTTCSPQVPWVAGVSDSVPKSGAGVASLSIWQGARSTTVHSYIVDKETWNSTTWCTVDKVRLAIMTQWDPYIYTLSWCSKVHRLKGILPKLIICNKWDNMNTNACTPSNKTSDTIQINVTSYPAVFVMQVDSGIGSGKALRYSVYLCVHA